MPHGKESDGSQDTGKAEPDDQPGDEPVVVVEVEAHDRKEYDEDDIDGRL